MIKYIHSRKDINILNLNLNYFKIFKKNILYKLIMLNSRILNTVTLFFLFYICNLKFFKIFLD